MGKDVHVHKYILTRSLRSFLVSVVDARGERVITSIQVSNTPTTQCLTCYVEKMSDATYAVIDYCTSIHAELNVAKFDYKDVLELALIE